MNTASKQAVNWPGAISDQEPDGGRELAEVHQEVARCLGCPRAVGVGGDAGQVNAAGAVLDDDQGVDAAEQHRVHVDEVGPDDAAGLRGQELLPGRPRAAGAGPVPAACRICHTVAAAIGWPSLTSSPCTRRCPHAGLSVATRITSLLIAAAVGGRPGRRRLV